MDSTRQVRIEGYSPDEILQLSAEELARFVFTGSPIVLRVGSAEVLGQFRLCPDSLVVELAQIEGGGEGVLPALWHLTEQFARQNGISSVEWIVHALNCAKPNLKLQRVLLRRGFTIQEVANVGRAYYFVNRLNCGNQA